jgi:probable phosphoglycerate mutase
MEIEQRFPEDSRRWRQRDASFGPAGGETLADFFERAVASVATIAARHRGGHVAVITHGGVLDALYRAATRVGIDAPRTWQLGNASINRLLHGDEGFTLVGWSDTFHLEDPALEEGGP